MTNPHMPNFENVKVGDKCFEAACGISTIAALEDNTIWASSVHWYYMDGKYMSCDKHPTLFNSFQQFLDYWAWEKDNGSAKWAKKMLLLGYKITNIDWINDSAYQTKYVYLDGDTCKFDSMSEGISLHISDFESGNVKKTGWKIYTDVCPECGTELERNEVSSEDGDDGYPTKDKADNA